MVIFCTLLNNSVILKSLFQVIAAETEKAATPRGLARDVETTNVRIRRDAQVGSTAQQDARPP